MCNYPESTLTNIEINQPYISTLFLGCSLHILVRISRKYKAGKIYKVFSNGIPLLIEK